MANKKKEEEEAWVWKPRDDEEEVGGDLNIWNPVANGKIGDELEGLIREIREGQLYGIEAEIVEDDGTVWTTPAHKVLQSAIAHLRVGDSVRITYTGTYMTAKGMTTTSYKVARKK